MVVSLKSGVKLSVSGVKSPAAKIPGGNPNPGASIMSFGSICHVRIIRPGGHLLFRHLPGQSINWGTPNLGTPIIIVT